MATRPEARANANKQRAPRECIDDLVNMNVSDMTDAQRERFEIKREHEFYSYYEPIRALAKTEMNWTDLNCKGAVARHRPVPSPDKALTAFCQLAAIRLQMRRAMVFFFDSTHAYVLAEATRTLSLHDDAVFEDAHDGLWLGSTRISRGFSVCEHTVNLPCNGGTNADAQDSHIIHIINDLAEDTRFCDRPYVTGGPKAKFYAGVPITTPKGLKIGAFCVLDDKPRQGLAVKEVGLMQEMSAAVMGHLDMIKAKVEQRRGNDMLAALGAFTASDSSSRRDTKHDTSRPNLQHDVSATNPLLTIGNLDSPRPNKPAMRRLSSSTKNREFLPASDYITNIREKSPRRPRPFLDPKNRSCSDTAVYSQGQPAPIKPTGLTETLPEEANINPPEQSPRDIMQSASLLIRNAVDADGVLFLDAAVSGFGDLVDSSMIDISDYDADTGHSGTDGPSHSDEEAARDKNEDGDEQPCQLLGASFGTRNGNNIPPARREVASHLTPKFLRYLLRRFKGGKVWNFNENGDDYLDDPSSTTSDGEYAPSGSISKSKGGSMRRRGRKQMMKDAPGKQLALAFPGVRSLMVIGLWDPSRSQWRAGCVIWSCAPMRMFSDEGEMHYLTAFCDVIMAKLARLEVDVANNVKSDFISSISHELRSPLHGILGTVEVLQDQPFDTATAEMISQIDTCGRTLLDIVDHLLDFSRINALTKHSGSRMRTDLKGAPSSSADRKGSDTESSPTDTDISLDVVTEEVVESAVYSFCCSKDQRILSERNVAVSMDIENNPDIPWECKVTVGAWKRIAVNLLNNALKYTTEGYIHVSLKIIPPKNKLGRPVAQLSVSDTGCGMSKDFLRNKLFRAFSQEDDLAEGTGLGMSMVAKIVKGWKGKVDVRSSKGQGSIVSVTMPMKLTRRATIVDLDGIRPETNTEGLSGLSMHVLGASNVQEQSLASTGRHQQLLNLGRMCSGMGMSTTGPSWNFPADNDFAVIAEHNLPHLVHLLTSPESKGTAEEDVDALRRKPIIVLCKDYVSARHLRGSRIEQLTRGRIEYVAQPCGPNRLATVLGRTFDFTNNGEGWSTRPSSPLTPAALHDAITPRGDQWREWSTWSGAPSPMESDSSRHLTFRDRRTHSDARPSSAASSHSLSLPAQALQTPANTALGLGVEGPDVKAADTDRSTLPEVTGALTAALPTQAPPSKAASRVADTAVDPTKPCLLLVDDNPINLQLLITYSKKNGHAMMTANNGSKAVEAYKTASSSSTATDIATTEPTSRRRPEVILMDISMPIMDGFEAARRIRAYEREQKLKPVVIIALTGLGSSEAQHEAFVSGINLFLTKPVRLKELTKLLGTIKDTVA